MKTIVVYVLVLWMGGYYNGGPTIIDNISSAQNCQNLRVILQNKFSTYSGYGAPISIRSRCIAVRKVVAQ